MFVEKLIKKFVSQKEICVSRNLCCIKYLEISFFSKFSSLGKCFLLWINYTIWSEGLFIVSVDWYDILLFVEISISDMQCATIVPLSSVNIVYVNIARSTGSDPSFLSMTWRKKSPIHVLPLRTSH